ncbi:putative transcription factor Trihelix family [Lupinus albus]|uniref:Putative transcription factor Trihelix family n=1 Tax=Lupinus albus TaxID=3870 RepID=A0A6A4QET5_LUPAL|nr:putative transcription factor Trihelix family [Lupinus albus]
MEHHHRNHRHHYHYHHDHQQQQQYGITDLRHLMNGQSSTHFTSIPLPTQQPTAELFPGHRNLTPHHHQHYEMMMFNHEFASTDSIAPTGITVTTAATMSGDAYTGRWPRQETLTLLEIRSRLHPKFKEANQKGPLWDEVSRYHTTNLFFFTNNYSSSLITTTCLSFFNFFLLQMMKGCLSSNMEVTYSN